MTQEIDWNSPVVGKLEDGKTYRDRQGVCRVVKAHRTGYFISTLPSDVGGYWGYNCGGVFNSDARHIRDLIAEVKPLEPLKMWMNSYPNFEMYFHKSREIAIAYRDKNISGARVAIPVTITEGH